MEKTKILEWIVTAEDRFAESICYSCGAQNISFSDVSRLSRAVGTALSNYTIPCRPVAVMTGRHVFTPVCYLGAAMAGCFYAAMDAELPDARLRQMIAVSKTSIMIADEVGRKRAAELGFAGTILSMEELLETEPDDEILSEAQEHITELSPLYMIFTSGSTGMPKGVLTAHYSLYCYLDGLNRYLSLSEDDVLGNQAPLD